MCVRAWLQALQRLAEQAEATSLGGSNWHGLRILGRSRLFIKLTASTMLSGIVTEGVYELVAQFLQLKLGFGVLDMVRPFGAQAFSKAPCGALINNHLLPPGVQWSGHWSVL